MSKTIRFILAAALTATLATPQTGPRENLTLTITAGTPYNVGASWASATSATASDSVPRLVERINIQMGTGGSGVGYVMGGISYKRVPSHSNSSDLSAQLCAATSTSPGCSYSDTDSQGLIDISQLWIDGANSGDTVVITFNRKF